MSTNSPTAALSEAGVSIWLDDLSRDRITTGDLARLIAERNVVGVTTNPTIFANALAKGDRYEKQVEALAAKGADVEQTVFEVTTDDVRTGCDLFAPVFQSSQGLDGKVSIEVDPRLAKDTDGVVSVTNNIKISPPKK